MIHHDRVLVGRDDVEEFRALICTSRGALKDILLEVDERLLVNFFHSQKQIERTMSAFDARNKYPSLPNSTPFSIAPNSRIPSPLATRSNALS